MAAALFGTNLPAQTIEEMQAQKAAKEAELAAISAQLAEVTAKADALKAEVASLTDKLTPYPRWDVGLLGNVGLSFSQFKNWYSKAQPNTLATNIGFTLNSFANLQQKKYFWRNSSNLTLAWLKFDDQDKDDDTDDFQVAADAFNLVSLFGYKLSEKWAISTLGEYRTAVLDERFNNPGYLDLGAGATWTPITDMVVVFHPLNYNIVFSDDGYDYESSLGCKIVGDYARKITKSIAWKSNLSAFLSYKGADLSNWTWVNSFSTAVKGVGIGFDLGLRSNKQEAYAYSLTTDPNPAPSIGDFDDNSIQVYWLLGFSYAIATKK
jgi:hypothetical protein